MAVPARSQPSGLAPAVVMRRTSATMKSIAQAHIRIHALTLICVCENCRRRRRCAVCDTAKAGYHRPLPSMEPHVSKAKKPDTPATGGKGEDARKNRLAAQLRANLARRKAQARGRAGEVPPSDELESAPSDKKNG